MLRTNNEVKMVWCKIGRNDDGGQLRRGPPGVRKSETNSHQSFTKLFRGTTRSWKFIFQSYLLYNKDDLQTRNHPRAANDIC